MKCKYCNCEIQEDSVFCPECGKKQQKENVESSSFCAMCGAKIEDGSMFCPACGAKVGESQPETVEIAQQPMMDNQMNVKKIKGKGPVIILIFLLIAVVLVGFIIFAIRKLLIPDIQETKYGNSFQKEELYEDDWYDDTFSDNLENIEEDIVDADYDLTYNEFLSLDGYVKSVQSGEKVLQLEEDASFYGISDDGEKVLIEDVTKLYLDEEYLPEGFLDSIEGNQKVMMDGQVYIQGVDDRLYMVPEWVYDNNYEDMIDAYQEKGDYILPQSDKVLLNRADIEGLSLQEINYAKNEVYARHGRLFKSKELQDYFDSKDWYFGTISADSFSEKFLSDIEKKNVEFLKDIEFGMSPNGYQLDAN